jgi:hypothetical protein
MLTIKGAKTDDKVKQLNLDKEFEQTNNTIIFTTQLLKNSIQEDSQSQISKLVTSYDL